MLCPFIIHTWELSESDVSRWAWDQGHNGEQHPLLPIWIYSRFSEEWSALHFTLWKMWRFLLPDHKLSVPEKQFSIFVRPWCFYLAADTICQGLLLLWMLYSEENSTFMCFLARICQGTYESSFRNFYGRYLVFIKQAYWVAKAKQVPQLPKQIQFATIILMNLNEEQVE